METEVFGSTDGEVFSVGPSRMRLLAQSPAHPIAITDNTVPPGFAGPLRHRHTVMTDIFYVLEGELAFRIGDEQQVVGPGGFVLVPPGVVHTFSNPGASVARFLNIYHPSGNEHYLVEVSERAATGRSTSPEEMAEIASRYDFEFEFEPRPQP